MKLEFTPHPPKIGDIYYFVQTFAGKTTIEQVRVHLVTMHKISCTRMQEETYRQVSFFRKALKDGGFAVSMCRPYTQNGLGYPEAKNKEAYAEFYRRGGKDA